MNFIDLFSRADAEIMQKIISRSAILILNRLDCDTTRLSIIRQAVLNIYSPQELLLNKEIRNDLLDLLRPDEAESLVSQLCLANTYDIYQFLKDQNFNTKNLKKRLLEYFEIDYIIDVVNENEIPDCSTIEPLYPLFKHQRNALKELETYLSCKNGKAFLHMPTGSGKTRTAMNYVSELFRKQENTIIIWLAHTEELCYQAVSEFQKSWNYLGNRNIELHKYWGDSNPDLDNIHDGFVVAGLSKIYNLAKSNPRQLGNLASHCSLVIMDEAHMSIAPTYQLVLELLLTFNSSLLGLSATPGRTWNDVIEDEKLSLFYNRNKVTLKVDGYTNPIDYLVAEEYLASVKSTPLFFNSGYEMTTNDFKFLKEYFHLPDNFLIKLSEDYLRNLLIINKIKSLISEHKRIILFALTVKHSNLIATILSIMGIKAYSLTANTDPILRRNIITEFKSNSHESIVLCNYGILTTGFDAPQTSCAVITRPTDSLVLYSQMIGRAIRGVKAKGNKEAEIVTVIDSCLPGFDSIASAFFNWEDVW